MKILDNPIIHDFLKNCGSLQCAETATSVWKNEPWKSDKYPIFINHALRWAISQPNTMGLIRVLFPYSDQIHDCRTLFKEACVHNRVDVLELLEPHIDAGVLQHNKGHAIFIAAQKADPNVLSFFKNKIGSISLRTEWLFLKSVEIQGHALQSLHYLFPHHFLHIHSQLFLGATLKNQVANLRFLIDKIGPQIKHYDARLKVVLKEAANHATTRGHQECLHVIIDAHKLWFGTDLDFLGLAHRALAKKNSSLLLNLTQRCPNVQRFIQNTAQHSSEECVQQSVSWIQHQRLTHEIQNVTPKKRARKI